MRTATFLIFLHHNVSPVLQTKLNILLVGLPRCELKYRWLALLSAETLSSQYSDEMKQHTNKQDAAHDYAEQIHGIVVVSRSLSELSEKLGSVM